MLDFKELKVEKARVIKELKCISDVVKKLEASHKISIQTLGCKVNAMQSSFGVHPVSKIAQNRLTETISETVSKNVDEMLCL